MINPMIRHRFTITHLQKGSYVVEKSRAHQYVSLRAPLLKVRKPPIRALPAIVAGSANSRSSVPFLPAAPATVTDNPILTAPTAAVPAR